MEDKLAESQSYIKYLEAKLEEKEKSKKKTTSKKKVKSKKKITSKKKSVTPKTNWWDPLPSKEKKKREPSSSSVDSFFDSVEEKGKKAKEKALHIESRIKNINIGNINDDFDTVKNADWIVEAVVERIDIKHNIYEKIFKNRKSGAIVSSNTSSIPIKVLSEKLTNDEKKDFCITHFLIFK